MPTWGHPTANDDDQRSGRGQDMPEENTATVDNGTQAATAEKTFTQSEMDAIIGDRIKRERAKYADYSELKRKAAAYDEAAEASKTELEKAVEERDMLKAELDRLNAERERAQAVARAAAEYGVDADTLSRMSGDVDENAEFLKSKGGVFAPVPDYGEAKAPAVKPSTAQKFGEAFDAMLGK